MTQMGTSVIPAGMHTCAYCGPNTYHIGVCPHIESIEYHANGRVRKVTLRSSSGPEGFSKAQGAPS